MHRGGIRRTVFGTNNGLTKAALVLMDGRVKPFVEWHQAAGAAVADVTGVLMHYPFVSTFRQKVEDAVRTGRYGAHHDRTSTWATAGSSHAIPALCLKGPSARRFNGLEPLIADGFLVVSDDYVRWVRDHTRRRGATHARVRCGYGCHAAIHGPAANGRGMHGLPPIGEPLHDRHRVAFRGDHVAADHQVTDGNTVEQPLSGVHVPLERRHDRLQPRAQVNPMRRARSDDLRRSRMRSERIRRPRRTPVARRCRRTACTRAGLPLTSTYAIGSILPDVHEDGDEHLDQQRRPENGAGHAQWNHRRGSARGPLSP